MPDIAVFKSVSLDKQIVFAEVYAPGRPDTDREFMTSDEIEKMAHAFMKSMKLDQVDEQHDNIQVNGCCVIESFIARKGDPDFIEGAWVVGMHIDNPVTWAKIKKGEINGFSLEAMVRKTPTEITLELPPVLSGLTMKADGHTHEFMVAYDSEGNFVGGKTTEQDGHFHLIRRGTITEETNGHTHRFSHVDQLQLLPGLA